MSRDQSSFQRGLGSVAREPEEVSCPWGRGPVGAGFGLSCE